MKQIIFFILGILIFWPLHLILAFTYGTTSSAEAGWYQELLDKGIGGKILFFSLGIFFLPIIWFMRIFYPIWEEMAD